MAMLRSSDNGDIIAPSERHLIGRSPAADTRLRRREISGEHAALRWNGDRWELRDLGSRNGTWVDERRLTAGERVFVDAGARLAFGNPAHVWELVTAGPPALVAVNGEATLEATSGLLALPSEDDPQAVLSIDPELGWCLEEADGARRLTDGEVLVVGGRRYTLRVPSRKPEDVERTEELMLTLPDLERLVADSRLAFAVSADEEYTELTLTLEGQEFAIPPRAHHYLLLFLARRRIEDAAAGVADGEQGWVYTADLRDKLKISPNQFYVMSHRCRRDFERLGVADPAHLIEKRTTSRQIRIGVSELSVRGL